MRKTLSVTYVLHLTYPDGSTAHYVGATQRGRVNQRVYEHRHGRGADFTNAAVKAGAHIELGYVMHSWNTYYEQALARSPALPKICQTCLAGQAR